MMTQLLLVPDVESLRRKLAHPPPLLAKLYARFRQRLANIPEDNTAARARWALERLTP